MISIYPFLVLTKQTIFDIVSASLTDFFPSRAGGGWRKTFIISSEDAGLLSKNFAPSLLLKTDFSKGPLKTKAINH